MTNKMAGRGAGGRGPAPRVSALDGEAPESTGGSHATPPSTLLVYAWCPLQKSRALAHRLPPNLFLQTLQTISAREKARWRAQEPRLAAAATAACLWRQLATCALLLLLSCVLTGLVQHQKK